MSYCPENKVFFSFTIRAYYTLHICPTFISPALEDAFLLAGVQPCQPDGRNRPVEQHVPRRPNRPHWWRDGTAEPWHPDSGQFQPGRPWFPLLLDPLPAGGRLPVRGAAGLRVVRAVPQLRGEEGDSSSHGWVKIYKVFLLIYHNRPFGFWVKFPNVISKSFFPLIFPDQNFRLLGSYSDLISNCIIDSSRPTFWIWSWISRLYF